MVHPSYADRSTSAAVPRPFAVKAPSSLSYPASPTLPKSENNTSKQKPTISFIEKTKEKHQAKVTEST